MEKSQSWLRWCMAAWISSSHSVISLGTPVIAGSIPWKREFCKATVFRPHVAECIPAFWDTSQIHVGWRHSPEMISTSEKHHTNHYENHQKNHYEKNEKQNWRHSLKMISTSKRPLRCPTSLCGSFGPRSEILRNKK